MMERKGPPPPPAGGPTPRRSTEPLVHDIKRVVDWREVAKIAVIAFAILAWSTALFALGVGFGRLDGALECIKAELRVRAGQ